MPCQLNTSREHEVFHCDVNFPLPMVNIQQYSLKKEDGELLILDVGSFDG